MNDDTKDLEYYKKLDAQRLLEDETGKANLPTERYVEDEYNAGFVPWRKEVIGSFLGYRWSWDSLRKSKLDRSLGLDALSAGPQKNT